MNQKKFHSEILQEKIAFTAQDSCRVGRAVVPLRCWRESCTHGGAGSPVVCGTGRALATLALSWGPQASQSQLSGRQDLALASGPPTWLLLGTGTNYILYMKTQRWFGTVLSSCLSKLCVYMCIYIYKCVNTHTSHQMVMYIPLSYCDSCYLVVKTRFFLKKNFSLRASPPPCMKNLVNTQLVFIDQLI